MHFLERSEQEVPRTPEQLDPLAYSVPLHGLEQYAPPLETEYSFEDIDYPFSNDETAAYYIRLQARTSQADYRNATNRTAIIIGEGALMAALPYIPEETIIVLDNSMPMLAFMKGYIEALREAGSVEEWGDIMGLRGADEHSLHDSATRGLIRQVNEWGIDGFATPFKDRSLYDAAHDQAMKKAIIPWHGDVTDGLSMRSLGQALRGQDANVTFMNLSNVLPCDDKLDTAAEYSESLGHLPFTSQAPIMTTAAKLRWDYEGSDWRDSMQATGPFFGLANFAEHGGSLEPDEEGAVSARQYINKPPEPSKPHPWFILSSGSGSSWPAE